MAQKDLAEKRIALVTGANRGIGLEIVRQLARRGLTTVLAARDLAKGHAAAARLSAGGVDRPAGAIDVTEGESVRAGVADVLGRFARIDVLVNNAGVLKEGFSPED